MGDTATAGEGARVDKYSAEQVEYSRQMLGREPLGADLQAHHAAPAHGTTRAGQGGGDKGEGEA
jgi:hypothetical protein